MNSHHYQCRVQSYKKVFPFLVNPSTAEIEADVLVSDVFISVSPTIFKGSPDITSAITISLLT